MQAGLEPSSTPPTARERSRLALNRIADTLGCRPEVILDAADSDVFPDDTAEMVRLWLKLNDPKQRQAVLVAGRAALAKKYR